MDIKNFKTGQTAYSVYFKSGKYIIKKEIVCKSGRKYVYTENEYNKYELFYGDEDYLIESEYSGYKRWRSRMRSILLTIVMDMHQMERSYGMNGFALNAEQDTKWIMTIMIIVLIAVKG